MKSEKTWYLVFFTVIALWFTILSTTFWVSNKNILVDTEVDITIPTLIPLSINLVYLGLSIFVFIVYLVAFEQIKGKQQRAIAKKYNFENDLCSIIIPARNEENVIERTVTSVLRQTHKKIEVLVICHNSDDKTFENAHVDDNRVKVFDYKTKEVGKGVALNYGVKNAEGKYILIVDADGLLDESFIENTIALFYNEDFAAVQGRFISSNRNYNFLTKMLSMEDDLWSSPFMTVRTLFGNRCPLAGTGYIIRKDKLTEAKLFSSSLVDDYDLTYRLLRMKNKITYAPLSIAYDEKPPDLSIMIRQRARWAKGFIDFLPHRIAESKDIIGNLNWLSPIATLNGLALLLLISYASIHNLLFEYYPFIFSYLPLNVWILTTILLIVLSALTIVKQYGKQGVRNLVYLPLHMIFSHYSFVVTLKAFFVKSWGNTKTMHGFIVKGEIEAIMRQVK